MTGHEPGRPGPGEQVEVLGWTAETPTAHVGAQVEFAADGRLTGLRSGAVELVAGLGVAGFAPAAAPGDTAGGAAPGDTAGGAAPGDTAGGAAPGETVGGPQAFAPDQVEVAVDEVEAQGDCAGLRIRVRHTFDHTWRWRIQLRNPGPTEIRGRLLLTAAPGADALLAVHAAGSVGMLTFQRPAGACLGLRLTRGDLVDDDGRLGTIELVLGPEEAYTLAFQGQWYADLAEFRQRYPVWFPAVLDLTAGDVDEPIGHADAVVTEVEPGTPWLRHFHVSDADGTARLEVAYADPPTALAEVIRGIERRGVLASAAEGLCVQQAVADRSLAHDQGREWLEEYADRTPDAASGLRAILWLRMYAQTGADDLLARGEADLAGLDPGPGCGIGWLNLWTLRHLAGTGEPDPGVAARLWSRARSRGSGAATLAELGLMLRPRGADDRARLDRATWEVATLCRSRPAGIWPPRPAADLAHAAAVHAQLGGDAQAMSRHLTAQVTATEAAADVLAWLGLIDGGAR